MKTLKEKIKVMQAALDGKEIEYRNYPYDERHTWSWSSFVGNGGLVWNWPNVDYRIKPEPIERWYNKFSGYPMSTTYDTKEQAEEAGKGFSDCICSVKLREVME